MQHISTEPSFNMIKPSLYQVGDRIDCIIAYFDEKINTTRVHPCSGEILQVLIDAAYSSGDQVLYQVTGYNVHLVTDTPWGFENMPPYHFPRGQIANTIGQHNVIFVPLRFVIRKTMEQGSAYNYNMDLALNRFFRRTPCGWVILYHEPQEVMKQAALGGCVIDELTKSFEKLWEMDYADETSTTNKMVRQKNQPKDRRISILKRGDPLPCNDQGTTSQFLTRRVVAEVLDFGVDEDGVIKVICRCVKPMSPPPCADYALYPGPFSEVSQYYAESDGLFKLPFIYIHDAYDQLSYGPPTFHSVVKHIVCDTLQRFRIKTVKYVKEGDDQGDEEKNQGDKEKDQDEKNQDNRDGFYYGFTEDGYHFSKTSRMELDTQSLFLSTPDLFDPQYEARQKFAIHNWLNLRSIQDEDGLHYIKRGYIIYGRVVSRSKTGKTTLEWCTPPPGLDLLRVYLATDGKSHIFKNISIDQVREKLKTKEGEETVASKLFEGILDPVNATNDVIEYVKRELMWAK